MRHLVLAFLFILSSVAFAQEQPELVVQNFIDAVNRKDLDGAAQMVKGGSVSPFLRQAIANAANWPTFAVSDLLTTVNGESATASCHSTISVAGQQSEETDDRVNLVRVGSSWLIVPPNIASASILPMLAREFTDAEHRGQMRASGKALMCLNNIKQLALGTIMLTSDYDDVYKFTATTWSEKIYPYTKNRALLTCPFDKKGTISYSFNARLAGKIEAKVKEPTTTVLIYEGNHGHLHFHKDGKVAVAFADGHARLVTKQETKSLRWKP